MYLSNGGEPKPDANGGGSLFCFVSRRKSMINPVNIKNLYMIMLIMRIRDVVNNRLFLENCIV